MTAALAGATVQLGRMGEQARMAADRRARAWRRFQPFGLRRQERPE